MVNGWGGGGHKPMRRRRRNRGRGARQRAKPPVRAHNTIQQPPTSTTHQPASQSSSHLQLPQSPLRLVLLGKKSLRLGGQPAQPVLQPHLLFPILPIPPTLQPPPQPRVPLPPELVIVEAALPVLERPRPDGRVLRGAPPVLVFFWVGGVFVCVCSRQSVRRCAGCLQRRTQYVHTHTHMNARTHHPVRRRPSCSCLLLSPAALSASSSSYPGGLSMGRSASRDSSM